MTAPQQRWTDEELLDILARVAAGYDGSGRGFSQRRYDEDRDPGDPSGNTVRLRFGSWPQAVEMAGVKAAPSPRMVRKYEERDFARAYWRVAGDSDGMSRPTYDSRKREGEPSGFTFIHRYGGWTQVRAVMESLREGAGE